MYRTILVPLDGTDFGEQALPVAMAIARRSGARVILAHVHELSAHELATHEDLGFADRTELEGRKKEWQWLARTAAEMTATGVPTTATLLDGPPADALERHAQDVAADLVVMTTHGRSPLVRAVLGSVAGPLAGRLGVPTVLVRPAEPGMAPGRPAPARHLLVALDGTPGAETMLPAAAELAGAMGARVTLLRVVDAVTHSDLGASVVMLPYVDGVGTEQLQEAATAYLERIAAPLRKSGLDVRTRVVVHPVPASAILEEAHALGCDLIALESHGGSGLARFILGSVADSVVRGATTPVMVHTTTHALPL